jgi:hypothetical protein
LFCFVLFYLLIFLSEKYQRKVAQAGALMPLLMQLGSPSVDVQEHAAKALANLAENSMSFLSVSLLLSINFFQDENQAKICGAGGIRSLCSLLTSKHPGVLLNITKVLANLSSNRKQEGEERCEKGGRKQFLISISCKS